MSNWAFRVSSKNPFAFLVQGYAMKGIFTTKPISLYNDLPETRYHFPRTYLNQVQRTVGDWIIYYEPRRSSAEPS